MEITGKQGKYWRNLKNSKSKSRNTWLICECKVRDGDFRRISEYRYQYRYYRYFAKVSIQYRYLFSSILPITIWYSWSFYEKHLAAPGTDPVEGKWGKYILPNPKFFRKNCKFRKKTVLHKEITLLSLKSLHFDTYN